ncbi:MAG: hypothetical protein IJ466_01870 [Clostridia bacterium]|nr:hypothetical protein [Clostridia bacterium]
MEDKKIMNHASLNDSELEAVSGGAAEQNKMEADPYTVCRICGGDMGAARFTDYFSFGAHIPVDLVTPACVCLKCGHEEYRI